ncbi:MAG: nitroreductase family protein [candidate division Zixibacteria bacterium]|nr:nitroreductase family protein [candidate division Zixibacteria bacterium]
MEFFEVIKERHSIRMFKTKNIEKDKLDKLLYVANSAPSAGGLQAYQIFLVSKLALKNELAKAAYGQEFIAQAPVNLVFCSEPLRSARKYGKRGAELYSIQDATISAAYVHLAAVDLELGSVIVGAFDQEVVSRILNLPDRFKPIIILPVGYPAEKPYVTARRKINDLVKEI